jgi:hypothetical protein
MTEIRDSTGTLVTLIEILSPANKCGRGLKDYQYKRRAWFEAAINLVEIDLLLGGEPIFPEALENMPEIRGAHYFINIKRAGAEDLRKSIALCCASRCRSSPFRCAKAKKTSISISSR